MTERKIKEIMERFSSETKKLYGQILRTVILYGSCARGDFTSDSDIDVMVLLDIPQDKINEERRRILDISDKLDWDYDVVLTPVIQNYQVYHDYLPVSKFYQNVQKEGVRYA